MDYSLSSELLHRIGRELAEHGRSEMAAESCVRDKSGEMVAKLSATYVVLRRPCQQ